MEGAGKDYGKGMELIFQRLFDTLKKLGLEPIDSQGQPFDPHIHHAVEKQETEEVAERHGARGIPAGIQFQGPVAAAGHGEGCRCAGAED